jgi:hypothetical protein
MSAREIFSPVATIGKTLDGLLLKIFRSTGCQPVNRQNTGWQPVLRAAIVLAIGIAVIVVSDDAIAGNHEAHFNPANPRPDVLPRTHYNAWVPYRLEYNRPTYFGGHLASVIEPSSQEAMSWCQHKANGDYHCHRPGSIPIYNYPKPWEALSIDARPAK